MTRLQTALVMVLIIATLGIGGALDSQVPVPDCPEGDVIMGSSDRGYRCQNLRQLVEAQPAPVRETVVRDTDVLPGPVQEVVLRDTDVPLEVVQLVEAISPIPKCVEDDVLTFTMPGMANLTCANFDDMVATYLAEQRSWKTDAEWWAFLDWMIASAE